jgi:hypothetical protein
VGNRGFQGTSWSAAPSSAYTPSTAVTASYTASAGDVAFVWQTGYCNPPTTGTSTAYNGQGGSYVFGSIHTSVNGAAYTSSGSNDYLVSGAGPGGYVPIGDMMRMPLAAGSVYNWAAGAYNGFSAACTCWGGVNVLIVH